MERINSVEQWREVLIKGACSYNANRYELFEESQRRFSLPTKLRGQEYDILQRLNSLNQQIQQLDNANTQVEEIRLLLRYEKQKTDYLENLAKDIRGKKRFHIFPKLLNALNMTDSYDRESAGHQSMSHDVGALFLLMGDHTRILAGLKGRDVFKKVLLPEFDLSNNLEIPYLVSPYLFYLETAGEKEVSVYPSAVMSPEDYANLSFPTSGNPLEDVLEDAYYDQHYNVPEEGADVLIRGGLDAKRISLVQSDNNIWAGTLTPYGELLTIIDLNNLTVWSQDKMPEITRLHGTDNDSQSRSPLARLVASTYHDLVTAVKSFDGNSHNFVRSVAAPQGTSPGSVEDISFIYIPRTIYSRTKTDENQIVTCPPYNGTPRIRPHKVIGYRKKGEMTNHHRQELQLWQAKTGIKVPQVPIGYTWVRPHISPSAAEESLIKLPKFIKLRIVEKLSNPKQ